MLKIFNAINAGAGLGQLLYCALSACSLSARTNVPARAVLVYIKALYHIQTQMKLRVGYAMS